jgi:hypothetical protein
MNFEDFISIFFTLDYFLVLLIILLLILLVLTLQLIKNNYTKEEKETSEDNNDTLDNLFIDFMSKKPEMEENKVIDEKNTMNEINYYEKNEEECAIISNDELEKASKIRNINTNSDLINQYELEQEKKAIISYEELLKNASNLKMNYEDISFDNEGPVIKKIDVETPTLERNLSYMDETNFLNTLKEFRANLK